MLRTALLFFCLLGLVASALPATASSSRRKPIAMRNQRLTRGNHTPVYKTYRFHSKQDRPLFSFLHFGGHSGAAKHHNARATHPPRRHTTGIF